MSLLALDTDAVHSILNVADRKSLVTLSRTCRRLHVDATPFLLRWVTLTTSPLQALGFLAFTSHSTERSNAVRTIRLCGGVFRYGPQVADDAFYAEAAPLLANFLERAAFLEVFDCEMERLVEHEPRIASALVRKPPSRCLALRYMGPRACQALRDMSGIRDLTLVFFPSPAEPSVLAGFGKVIQNNYQTLRSFTLYGADMAFISTLSGTVFHNIERLRLEDPGVATIAPIQTVFPNLRSIGMGWHSLSTESESLQSWPTLQTLEGDIDFLLRLAPVSCLRYVRVSGYVTTDEVFDSIMEAVRQSDVLSLCLRVEMKLCVEDEEKADLLIRYRIGISGDKLVHSLRESLPSLQYLDLCLTDGSFKVAPILHRLVADGLISELGKLQNLKYLALRAAWGKPYAEEHYQYLAGAWPFMESLSFARILAENITTLEYIELDIEAIRWKYLWWRVTRSKGVPSLKSVSIKEGRSASDWYRSYAFNPLTEYVGSSSTWDWKYKSPFGRDSPSDE